MRDLSERAIACANWRWIPGMLLEDASKSMRLCRVFKVGDGWLHTVQPSGRQERHEIGRWLRPDLANDATLGCLLELAVEAYGDHFAHLRPFPTNVWINGPGSKLVPSTWWRWVAGDGSPYTIGRGSAWTFIAASTRAETLVLALENAPC